MQRSTAVNESWSGLRAYLRSVPSPRGPSALLGAPVLLRQEDKGFVPGCELRGDSATPLQQSGLDWPLQSRPEAFS